MINTAIDHLRKENLLPEIGAIDENIWQEEDKKGQSPDQALLYKEIVIHIKSLPPSYRIVFNMYVIDGFSHQEIGNQLGISVGTSKSNLFKARAILQKFIKKDREQIVV
jgi:RNA polymerase sigma-70 factor (ECF subfamily)